MERTSFQTPGVRTSSSNLQTPSPSSRPKRSFSFPVSPALKPKVVSSAKGIYTQLSESLLREKACVQSLEVPLSTFAGDTGPEERDKEEEEEVMEGEEEEDEPVLQWSEGDVYVLDLITQSISVHCKETLQEEGKYRDHEASAPQVCEQSCTTVSKSTGVPSSDDSGECEENEGRKLLTKAVPPLPEAGSSDVQPGSQPVTQTSRQHKHHRGECVYTCCKVPIKSFPTKQTERGIYQSHHLQCITSLS